MWLFFVFSSLPFLSIDDICTKLQQNNVFTVARRNVDGQELLYHSIKYVNQIYILSELKMQQNSPTLTVFGFVLRIFHQQKFLAFVEIASFDSHRQHKRYLSDNPVALKILWTRPSDGWTGNHSNNSVSSSWRSESVLHGRHLLVYSLMNVEQFICLIL